MSLSHKTVTQATPHQTLRPQTEEFQTTGSSEHCRHFPIDWSGPPGQVTTAPCNYRPDQSSLITSQGNLLNPLIPSKISDCTSGKTFIDPLLFPFLLVWMTLGNLCLKLLFLWALVWSPYFTIIYHFTTFYTNSPAQSDRLVGFWQQRNVKFSSKL